MRLETLLPVKNFLPAISAAMDQIQLNINNYVDPIPFHVIGHLADADGLSFEVAFSRMLTAASNFWGNDIEVTSHRIMEASPDPGIKDNSLDPKHEDSLEQIAKNYGDKLVIFGDLPTVNVKRALELLPNSIHFDHHNGQAYINGQYVNPCHYGIDGGTQSSAGILAALAGNDLLSRVEGADRKADAFKVFENQIAYLRLIGIAGSNADQQRAFGTNEPLYQQAQREKTIVVLDHPFYGHYTKGGTKVLAESNLPVNLDVRVSRLKNTRAFLLDQSGYPSLDEKRLDAIMGEHPYLFATKISGKETGLNGVYVDTLSSTKRTNLDHQLSELSGKNTDGLPKIIEEFCDDEKHMELRLLNADMLLRDLSIEPEKKLCELHAKDRQKLVVYAKESISAFGDQDMLDTYLGEFDIPYFAASYDGSRLMDSISIAELANLMTAFSKLGKSEIFNKVVDFELGFLNLTDVERDNAYKDVYSTWTEYKGTTFKAMQEFEPILLSEPTPLESFKPGSKFVALDDELYYADASFMRGIAGNNAETYTGVVAGIAVSTRLLPKNHGILLTGIPCDDDRFKISARVNRGPNDTRDLGSYGLMGALREAGIADSGGGHTSAASCKMPTKNIERALNFAREYLKG